MKEIKFEELAKMLRICSERDVCFYNQDTCPYFGTDLCEDKQGKAADAIEALITALTASNQVIAKTSSELRDCRNELCLRCGEYKMRHKGACDGCRWQA